MPRKKQDGEPTWVRVRGFGWLPDELPAFAMRVGLRRGLRVATGRYTVPGYKKGDVSLTASDPSEPEGDDWRWDFAPTCYRPLTTAARDLLAALKQEVANG